MLQSKPINHSDAYITKDSIISQLYSDRKLNEMLGKFNAGGGQEDLKSELFAVLCEKDSDFILDLWNKKQLLFYCTGVVQRMIFQVGGRFHRRYRNQSYEFTEVILNQSNEDYNLDKENRLQKLEYALKNDLHWVEKSIIDLYHNFKSIDKISKATKISSNQIDRIYKKAKEKLRTSLSGKLMGNYIIVSSEFVLDIPRDVTPDNINDILDETLEYMKMRLEGRMIPSKEKTNGYIKDIKPLKAKKII